MPKTNMEMHAYLHRHDALYDTPERLVVLDEPALAHCYVELVRLPNNRWVGGWRYVCHFKHGCRGGRVVLRNGRRYATRGQCLHGMIDAMASHLARNVAAVTDEAKRNVETILTLLQQQKGR